MAIDSLLGFFLRGLSFGVFFSCYAYGFFGVSYGLFSKRVFLRGLFLMDGYMVTYGYIRTHKCVWPPMCALTFASYAYGHL